MEQKEVFPWAPDSDIDTDETLDVEITLMLLM